MIFQNLLLLPLIPGGSHTKPTLHPHLYRRTSRFTVILVDVLHSNELAHLSFEDPKSLAFAAWPGMDRGDPWLAMDFLWAFNVF